MTNTRFPEWPAIDLPQPKPCIRWGIVGTGSIANNMAGVIADVPSAQLTAVASRQKSSAEAFAAAHNAERAFDSYAAMFAWDGIDAVYLAAPTGLREEMAVAAASAGKHVLVEKPFVSVASLQRIVDACCSNGVGFMDGTHFGHHPRTAAIRDALADAIGTPWSLTSTFQFGLTDPGNIRYDRTLEPMGAIGDVGWYNMRAIAEYMPPNLGISALSTYIRRQPESGAVVRGSGVIGFENGAFCTWTCGFDAGAAFTDLRLTGKDGVITVDDFPRNDADGSAVYRVHRGGFEDTVVESVRVPSPHTSRAWMFEDFAAMTANPALRERSIDDSLRTQRLLDAVWQNALENEREAKG